MQCIRHKYQISLLKDRKVNRLALEFVTLLCSIILLTFCVYFENKIYCIRKRAQSIRYLLLHLVCIIIENNSIYSMVVDRLFPKRCKQQFVTDIPLLLGICLLASLTHTQSSSIQLIFVQSLHANTLSSVGFSECNARPFPIFSTRCEIPYVHKCY